MNPLASALYPGAVTHVRLKPRVHKLSYRIYSLLLDIDELPALHKRLRFFSVDRFNLFSFHHKDRGDRSGRDLRGQVETSMRAAGLIPDGGAIRLLTMPRILGWAFNPLSVFFCYRRDHSLSAILWEVDNTFGERHGYIIPVESHSDGEIVQTANKAFHVSPFMDMQQRYVFRVVPPEETMSIVIETFDTDGGMMLKARHLARRVDLSDRALLRAFFTIPFLTLKVVGGIHWEALKLWTKGIRLRRHPGPASSALSVPEFSHTPKDMELHERA